MPLVPGVKFGVRQCIAALIATGHITLTTLAASQSYREGVFLGIESGDFVELKAWAEMSGGRKLMMANGSIEDAPVIPRTYRLLCNLPGWSPAGVMLVNSDVFVLPPDRIEFRMAPFSNVRRSIDRFEVGIPELEQWENVLRLRRSLKAGPDKPLYVFLMMSNRMTVVRYYPFRVERDN